jgi:hypothetical protein
VKYHCFGYYGRSQTDGMAMFDRRFEYLPVLLFLKSISDLTKQFGVPVEVATGPHERLAGLQDDSVLAMSPFL